jgi:SHS2 domain-containing protein
VYGEPIDLERHQPRADVKAITYYMFKVEEKDGRWQARVVVDI